MEFEDSLTLLRGNRSTTNKRSERPASSTLGHGKRFRAPIMDLIGFYDTPKPTEGTIIEKNAMYYMYYMFV